MGVEEKLALLRGMDLLGGFSEDTLRLLCEQCNEVYLNEGDWLFREGAPGEAMYLVLDGRVVVSKGGRQIAELGAGQSLGEMALIEDKPRAASVRAASEVLLMELTRLEFDRYLVGEPAALRALMETLSARIRGDLEALAGDITRMAVLAHDMRHCLTPLAQVEDYLADEARRRREAGDGAGEAAAREQQARVGAAIDEITTLIDQSLGRVRKLRLGYPTEATDLGGLLRQVAEELAGEARRRGVEVALELDGGAPPVPCNPLDIRRVLRNLLDNALEASPPGGRVTLSLLDLGGRLEVGVSDQGPGVAAALRDRLFRQPVTSKAEGSGLGLLSAREIVEDLHGGRLGYHRGPGEATRFYFQLPGGRP